MKKNNIDQLYNKYQKFDKNGWEELRIVKKYIKGDIFSYFNYEDNKGMFENMNGRELIEWYEKMKFSSIIDSKTVGMYEQCTYSNPSNNKDYAVYKEAIKKDFVQMMESKYNSLQL